MGENLINDNDSNSTLSDMQDEMLEEFKMENIFDPYADYKCSN